MGKKQKAGAVRDQMSFRLKSEQSWALLHLFSEMSGSDCCWKLDMGLDGPRGWAHPVFRDVAGN